MARLAKLVPQTPLAKIVGWFAVLIAVACSYTANLADDRNLSSVGAAGPVGWGGNHFGGTPSSSMAGLSGLGGATTATANPNRIISPEDLTRVTEGCTVSSIEPNPRLDKLALVVDVSGSMTSTAPGSTRSKWEVTRNALLEAVVGVMKSGLPASTSVGLLYYPNKINDDSIPTAPVDPSVCLNTDGEVGMAVLGDKSSGTQRSLLRQRLTVAVLGRGTPTVDAYNWALRHQLLTAQQLVLPGEPYILLITDGVPTLNGGCWNPNGALTLLDGEPIVRAVEAAHAQGVKTFIIGSPGSDEGRAWLSKSAYVGGTALPGCNPDSADGPYCHLDLTTAPDFSSALRDALGQIANNVAGCKYSLSALSAGGEALPALDKLAPIIRFSDGKLVLVGQSPNTSNYCLYGYRIVNDTQLQLCKNTCASLTDDPAATLQLVLGCSVDELLPP